MGCQQLTPKPRAIAKGFVLSLKKVLEGFFSFFSLHFWNFVDVVDVVDAVFVVVVLFFF